MKKASDGSDYKIIKEKILSMDSNKIKKTESKTKGKEVKIPDINSFKSNSFSQTTNKLLSKHISSEAGDCYFGENLARTTEYYGLKQKPWVALLVSGFIVLFEIAKKLLRRKKNEMPD